MKTLLVKGVVTAACLFVPAEVLANDHADQGKPEHPPAEEQAANGKGEKVSTEAKTKDHTPSKKTDTKGTNENANPVAGEKRPDHVQQSQPSDKKDRSAGKPATGPSKKPGAIKDSSKVNKGIDQRKEKVGTDHKDTKIHKARNDDPMKSKPSTSNHLQKKNKDSGEVETKSNEGQLDQKVNSNHQPEPGNEPPLPMDQPRKEAPVVMPSNPMTHLSKTTGNGDGHSTSSGSGFTLYGLLLQREGPLVTLKGDFLMEYRRAHNQWTNAPPSPPPKSNLLSQAV